MKTEHRKRRPRSSDACPLCDCLPTFYQPHANDTTFVMCENPSCLLYGHSCRKLTWAKMCQGTLRGLLMPKEVAGLLYRGVKTACLQPIGRNLVGVTSAAVLHDVKGWYAVPHFGAENAKQPPERRYYAPYQPGDILYVREPYWCGHPLDDNGALVPHTITTWFAADGKNPIPYRRFVNPTTKELETRDTPFWRPGATMSSSQARTFLLITSISIRRMQWLSNDDIFRQGCSCRLLPRSEERAYSMLDPLIDELTVPVPMAPSAQEAWEYFCAWRFGRAPWERNDWCWLYDVISINNLNEELEQ